MKTQVVSVSSRMPTEPYYYFNQFTESLRRFGAAPIILGMNEPWHGLMTKQLLIREFLRHWVVDQAQRVIICDAWDIVFTRHPDEIGEQFEDFDCDILFGAEKACFPHPELADRFPDPGTPWRFFNGGFMVGYPSALLAMEESMDLDAIGVDHRRADGSMHEPNDQVCLTKAFLDQPVEIKLDTKCELIQTLSGCELTEFDFSNKPFKNLTTGTTPGVWHGNGDGKNKILPTIFREMGL